MRTVLKGLIIIVVILAVAMPLASSNPDGLEATMEKMGLEENLLYHAPLDYGETWAQSLVMGIIGISLVFGVSYGLGKLIKGV